MHARVMSDDKSSATRYDPTRHGAILLARGPVWQTCVAALVRLTTVCEMAVSCIVIDVQLIDVQLCTCSGADGVGDAPLVRHRRAKRSGARATVRGVQRICKLTFGVWSSGPQSGSGTASQCGGDCDWRLGGGRCGRGTARGRAGPTPSRSGERPGRPPLA